MDKAEKSKESWRERRKKIKHKLAVPFVFVEWNCERLSALLKRWAFFEVLELLGRLSVVVAVIFYVRGCDDRKEAKHYQAWQIINSARGTSASGGRIDALQNLVKDKVSLSDVDLSNVNLTGIDIANADIPDANFYSAKLCRANLSRANLYRANLSEADLSEADLSGAYLYKANLSGANLVGADLVGADLSNAILSKTSLADANLSEVKLSYADLSEALLFGANLTDVNLSDANLNGSNLVRADLSKANLSGANLTNADVLQANLSEAILIHTNVNGANLWETNLTNIGRWQYIKNIEHANIYGVHNAPQEFNKWAMASGAVSLSYSDKDMFRREELLRKDEEFDKQLSMLDGLREDRERQEIFKRARVKGK